MDKQLTQTPVTAIVAAHNEESTIFSVIMTLLNYDLIQQVIVVDDGSTDKTKLILDRLHHEKLNLIRLESNHGKGCALGLAIQESQNDLLCFVDADIIGLTDLHLDQLIYPILTDTFDMTIGYPPLNRQRHNIIFNYFKWLSGERALKRDSVLPLVNEMLNAKYGVETIINYHHKKKVIRMFELESLFHRLKQDKYGFWKYSYEYLLEGRDILKSHFRLRYSTIKNKTINNSKGEPS